MKLKINHHVAVLTIAALATTPVIAALRRSAADQHASAEFVRVDGKTVIKVNNGFDDPILENCFPSAGCVDGSVTDAPQWFLTHDNYGRQWKVKLGISHCTENSNKRQFAWKLDASMTDKMDPGCGQPTTAPAP